MIVENLAEGFVVWFLTVYVPLNWEGFVTDYRVKSMAKEIERLG